MFGTVINTEIEGKISDTCTLNRIKTTDQHTLLKNNPIYFSEINPVQMGLSQLKNGSQEAHSGRRKIYWLRVNPDVTTTTMINSRHCNKLPNFLDTYLQCQRYSSKKYSAFLCFFWEKLCRGKNKVSARCSTKPAMFSLRRRDKIRGQSIWWSVNCPALTANPYSEQSWL